jgi:RimJ/RimL family protein N-acetyltransferase
MERDQEVRLRLLHGEDADWMVQLDRHGYGLLPSYDWDPEKLTAELDEGVWASSDQVGWAVLVDGQPAGFIFARRLDTGDGLLDMRLDPAVRGRGVGREVLRQIADHHFADHPDLRRLEGTTHEDNVPMQRAFNAAGFRMEARYRDSMRLADGGYASEWGYAITRSDWEAGLHRVDEDGYDLHGLTFALETEEGEPDKMVPGSAAHFLQERHRVLVRYAGGRVSEGEAAGILYRDRLRYRFMHIFDEAEVVHGWGASRIQRRQDGRLELIDEFQVDDGPRGGHVWVERR